MPAKPKQPGKSAAPRKVRSDATLKKLPREFRPRVLEWLEQDGEESCRQRCLSELQIASPKGGPIGTTTLYEALAFWRTQEIADEMFAYRDAQTEAFAKFKPGDDEMARRFGEFSMLQEANKTKDKDIFAVATMAADSRRRLDLEEKSGKTKAAQKAEQLAQGRARLAFDEAKWRFDAAQAVMKHLNELRAIQRDASLKGPEKVKQVMLKLWGAPPTKPEDAAS